MSHQRAHEEDPSGFSRNQPQPSAHPPLNTGLIPRDYLGARSDMAARPGPPGSQLNQPSPLFTKSLPLSYRSEGSPVTQSPLSPKTSANQSPTQSRSPASRVANAAFPVPPSNTVRPMYQSTDTTSADEREMASRHEGGSVTKPTGSYEPDRPTSSPANSDLSVSGDRPTPRAMPRTSSIDSAISSLSSASQKSNFDVKSISQADISNLVNAAGSAEAVIVHLLKEKHHAASQNSQLWKLVDKQRTLILGLNKDLDRAFKEKEKYKKKLKDLQDATPPVPPVDPSVSQTFLDDAEPASSESTVMPSRDDEKPEAPQRAALPSITTSGLPRGTASDLASAGSFSSPTSPGQRKLPHPVRKPPPAPLNLQQFDHVSEDIVDADSDSDYGDQADADESSSLGRGRRKTREEDDRDRENALHQGIEAPGADSADVNGSPYGAPTTIVSPGGTPAELPRELVTRSPPNVGATESLGSMLNSRSTILAPNNRSIASMPKSPGLPMSPRPEDRPLGSPLPRMPRDLAAQTGLVASGLPTSPRAGRPPVGFPNTESQSTSGRHGGQIPSIDPNVKIDSPQSPQFAETSIYEGLVSDEYPGLLLPPNALPLIQVRVSSSRLRPSRNSYMASRPLDEEPVFTLSVISRSQMAELWRIEKVIGALPTLDQQLRQSVTLPGKLPDRSIFSGHSPAKVDARRAALNMYFDSLLDIQMDERAALVLCQFLTDDAIEPRDDETSLLKGSAHTKHEMPRGPDGKPRKEGYLTKRGKNFGGWKARYFVLHGPELRYFESPGGAHMGNIKLLHAQIGKQSQNANSPPASEEDYDNQYRHAFLILEPKKKDSSALVRHVLCAESDEERDQWVDALMEYVEPSSSDADSRGTLSKTQHQQGQSRSSGTSSKATKLSHSGSKRTGRGIDSPDQDGRSSVTGIRFDDTIAEEPPIIGSSLEYASRSPRIPQALANEIREYHQHHHVDPASQSPKFISAPTNGAVIQDAGAWGNKPTTTTSVKEKKRSIWGFRTRSSFDLAGSANDSSVAPVERRENVKPVFGIPLAEAVKDCGPHGVEADLPAVVYRCIEYLHSKDAALEEGIFRLSGSNVVIKALKERFNNEGDVDFLTGDQYYDVHAVASLFKQYLRELPTTVLTRELHLDFLRVLELDDKQKKLTAFNSLVHQLPKPNLSLLRALSLFLIEIVNNSDVNKMTVRNVGIVFAPTLNIPAPVFSMFLTDFDSIFGDAEAVVPTVELTVENSLSPDDVRSPRHQMFSDIPTPSYNKTAFNGSNSGSGSTEPVHNYDTGFIPMQPSYEQPTYKSETYSAMPGNSSQYHSMNDMLNPTSNDSRSAKAKRRESSMLYMESTPGDFSAPPGQI
ncbi:hypothetical protein N7539_007400 [Penicillium diatomitis]|uniref:Uncharacterized protein n=1 Tax=Penicillium diatomitis TaxID=2819901 RepID=A0A9W9WVX1_9EURO|nr:uncharacterized protein N7539_007400 [Penicillium diatomitis]KAJ5477256.1 hypothetical protein N7539_007400 [Penicillium diatomitis]